MPDVMDAPPSGAIKLGSQPPPAQPAPATPPPSTTPVAKPEAPNQPPKRSAKAEMSAELRKRFGGADNSPPAPSTDPKGDTSAPSGKQAAPDNGAALDPSGQPAPDSKGKAPDSGDNRKESPWKLLKQFKERSTSLESENLALKQRLESMGDAAKVAERMTAAEKRAQELEEHIRFVDYGKSEEFRKKYQEPYEAAWKRATAELRELTIATPDGNQRMVTPDDLLQLVNLPLGQARKIAEELYGSFANDVMEHRREIRGLFEQQQNALEDARKNGVETTKKAQEQWKAVNEKIQEHIKSVWEQEQKQIRSNPEWAKDLEPIEGDEEGNERLKKGYALADAAFASGNPFDPRLSPEERAKIVKMHSAVRNRAAAYGRERFWRKQAQNRVAELTKELEAFKSSEPGKGAPAAVGVTKPAAGARESVFGALRQLGQPR